IRKVISLLLSNAVNNSRNNNIVIETTLGQASSNKVNIVLWVCNRINQDNLEAGLALQEFFENKNSQNSVSSLEISRRLLKNMGGKLLHQQLQDEIKVGFSLPLELAPNPVKIDNRSLIDQHCLVIAPKTLHYETLVNKLYGWRIRVTHISSIDLIDKNYLESHNFDCCIIDMDDPAIVGFINVHFLRELHSLMPPAVFISHTMRKPDMSQESYRWQIRSLAKPIHYGKLKVLLKKLVLLKSNTEGDYISLSSQAPPGSSLNKPLPEDILQQYKQQNALLVEDNIVNRQVVHSLLNRLGISNTIVSNGIEATALLCEVGRQYTLVLMDCEMPEMDGYEATRLIRQYEKRNKLAAIPIIAVTSHSSRIHQERAMEAGMSAFIRKPVSLDVLRRELDKCLSLTINNVVQINR
ncbi:MAG: response regulator, partial [Cellvibrionaceae bacterium]|nr:response regulator [Cellvibrionaceae bacterium]